MEAGELDLVVDQVDDVDLNDHEVVVPDAVLKLHNDGEVDVLDGHISVDFSKLKMSLS